LTSREGGGPAFVAGLSVAELDPSEAGELEFCAALVAPFAVDVTTMDTKKIKRRKMAFLN